MDSSSNNKTRSSSIWEDYVELLPALRSWALQRLTHEEAEDAVQEVAFHLAKLDPQKAEALHHKSAFLWKLCRRRSFDIVRRRDREQRKVQESFNSVQESCGFDLPSLESAARDQASVERRELARLLRQLSKKERQIIYLRVMKQVPVATIAQILRKSQDAVYKASNRAFRRLVALAKHSSILVESAHDTESKRCPRT